MSSIVSITQQGQLTIPAWVRKQLHIEGQAKAHLEVIDNTIVVKPQDDFWSLGGRLKSPIKASDADLRKAREQFAKEWPRKM